MASYADRPHIRRLRRNPRASICVQDEQAERSDGERPNRQVRATGLVDLMPDAGNRWTNKVQDKYLRFDQSQTRDRGSPERVVIRLRPRRLVAVASV